MPSFTPLFTSGSRLALMILLVAAWALTGCADMVTDLEELDLVERPEPPQIDEEVADKIRNGTVTTERPEVGSIGGCTATLVASDVAITAAHCVGYRTQRRRGRYRTFTLKKNGDVRRFTVDRYRSFSRSLGANDIALLSLSSPVPADFVRPVPLGASTPPDGTSLTVYGYGCTRIGGRGDGRKREATFEQGERSYHLCPGDSGGPVFNDDTGAITRINSGYRRDRGKTDIYAHVPGLYQSLRQQILDWSDDALPIENEPREQEEEEEEEETELTICGENAQVFETWTCTAERSHRHRCLPGGAPVWEACPHGCSSREFGEDDVCKGAPGEDTCGDTYRRYTEWTCASDDLTILRCDEGRLEFYRCANTCQSKPNGADQCVQ